MRDEMTLGVRRAVPDARGNWTPLPDYSGWAPREPKPRSSWWIVAAGAVLVLAARSVGL